MYRVAFWLICASIALTPIESHDVSAPANESSAQRRMSFHNRLLLNRAVLAGLKSIEVLVLVRQDMGHSAESALLKVVASDVARLGGRVLKTEPDLGYLRIAVPPGRLVDLAGAPDIEAYQISSLSRGAWYRDGPPEQNAAMFRGFEIKPITGPEPTKEYSHLPALTPTEARAAGFTADEDAGVGAWTKNHPTWDGRGVTIAVLETGLPSFADPVFRTAKTLDGRDVPKIVGIVNAIPPDKNDETRVRLSTVIDTAKTWTRVESRTYVLPRPGKFRMGMLEVSGGGNVCQKFGVLASDAGEVWLDTNGDASFQDEKPLADVNERFEPRVLKVSTPQRLDVSFVMGRGRSPDVVHVYLGRSEHQSMTASVAAGNVTDESLASGVAPNARLLLVRLYESDLELAVVCEAFIQVAQRKDVDILTTSTGLMLVPDTSADFLGALFSRLATAYRKTIIEAAGNSGLSLTSAGAYGDSLSVGGTLGVATHSALYGGSRLPGLIVHRSSAAGPAIDGAIKPDFLAPVERIAANPPWSRGLEAVPAKAPARRVPAGYEISCCTSASSPYAAGVAALLISAARQSNVKYSVATLNRALRTSARPIPGVQAHHQGNGALDIGAAWAALTSTFDPPRIIATANIVHPQAQYAARGPSGLGILEFGGWSTGTKGSRVITFHRETGPVAPVTYRLAWSAHDGTFSTASSLTLPLNVPVPLRVDIDVRDTGAHSGLLTLHDTATGAVVFRTQATIVAPHLVEPATGSLETTAIVPNMRQKAHYLDVPPETGAIALELKVSEGVPIATVIPSHGLKTNYYPETHPSSVLSEPGIHRLLMPNPAPGTWTLILGNWSMSVPTALGLGPRSDGDVEYTLRMRLLSATMRTQADGKGVHVEVTNRGSALVAPVIEAWGGTLRTHRAPFEPSGLPNLIEIDVPPDAAALTLDLRPERTESNVELFLYDCTTGECFSYDIAFPAARSQKYVVRKPKAGRWVAAVNAAPFPSPGGGFKLDEIITTGTSMRRMSSVPRQPGATWREAFNALPRSKRIQGGTPVVVFELLDDEAEKAEANRPWSTNPKFVQLRDRPAAIATAVYRR